MSRALASWLAKAYCGVLGPAGWAVRRQRHCVYFSLYSLAALFTVCASFDWTSLGSKDQSSNLSRSVESPKSGIHVTSEEVITFDKVAPWVILGRS